MLVSKNDVIRCTVRDINEKQNNTPRKWRFCNDCWHIFNLEKNNGCCDRCGKRWPGPLSEVVAVYNMEGGAVVRWNTSA